MPAYMDRLVRNREYDTSKIQALGFKAKYAMKEAVTETVRQLKSS